MTTITKASEVISRMNEYSLLAVQTGKPTRLHADAVNVAVGEDSPVAMCRSAMVFLWSKYGMEPIGASVGMAGKDSQAGSYVFGKDGKPIGALFHYFASANNGEARPYICLTTPSIDKERKPKDFFRSTTVDGLMSVIKRDNGECFNNTHDSFEGEALYRAAYSILKSVSVGITDFSFNALQQEDAIDLVNIFDGLTSGKPLSLTENISKWLDDTKLKAQTAINNKRETIALRDNFKRSSLIIKEIQYICEHKYMVYEITVGDSASDVTVVKSFPINEIKELVTEYPNVFGVHNMIRSKGSSYNEGLFSENFLFTSQYSESNNYLRTKGMGLDHIVKDVNTPNYKMVILPKNLHTSHEKEEARSDESIAPSVVAVARTKSEFF